MLKNKHLRVATFFCPPFSYWDGLCQYDTRFDNNTCEGKPDGLENNLLSVLSESYGFTYNLQNIVASPKDDPYGTLLNALVDGAADVAYCGFWIKDLLGNVDDFEVITVWNQQCITFLVPEPQIILSWKNILRPFTAATWLLIIAVAVLCSFVAFRLSRFHITKILKKDITSQDSLSSFILGIIGVTLGFPVPRTNAKYTPASVRILFMACSFSSLILISFYTMNIASFLTVPCFEPKIDRIEDLVANNFTWGLPEDTIVLSDIINVNTEAGRIFATRLRIEDLPEKRLKNRKYAIPVIRVEDYYYSVYPNQSNLEYYRENDLRVMKQKQSCYYTAIFVSKHSPLAAMFDIKMLKIFENGFFLKIRREVFGRNNDSIQKITEKKYQTSMEKPWGLDNLLGPFTVLAFGWNLSILMFAVEKLTYKYWKLDF